MLQKYKEIFYGILFGLGACTIDTVMHARMENTSFWIEMLQPQPAMIFYLVHPFWSGSWLVALAEEQARARFPTLG
jgi:hypothetical protein